MSFEEFSGWLGALALMITIANTIWVWVKTSGGELATRLKDLRATFEGAFKEVDTDLEDHDRRIGAIEVEMRHLPSKDQVSDLKNQLTEMNGKLATFDSELGSVARTVRRIEDHLMGERA